MTRPILNISGFSCGKSTSFASVLEPSGPLEQDLVEYDSIYADLAEPDGDSPAATAVRKFMDKLDGAVGDFLREKLQDAINSGDEGAVEEAFERMRFAYNRACLEEYKAGSADVPYLLDLGFGTVTKETSEEDTDGSMMHSLERAAEEADWSSNYEYGDMLRIRAMFRGDKLNKKSAYETSAMNPGVTGAVLDDVLEYDPTITKISQDDGLFSVEGMALTSDGLYMLSSRDAGPPSIVTSRFAEYRDSIKTGVFRTFRTTEDEPAKRDYIKFSRAESFIGLQRAYSADASRVSASKDFLEWYAKYDGMVHVVPDVSYGEASALSIVGKNSFEFKPSPNGLLNLSGREISPEGEESSFAVGRLSVVASLADSNYRPARTRKISVEIPYNELDLGTDVKFSASAVIDRHFANYAEADFVVELSLDDEKPMKFGLVSGTVNASSRSSLNEYLSETRPSGNKVEFSFKVANSSDKSTRVLYIGISSGLPAKPAGEAADSTAYESTYAELSDFYMSSRSGILTYGNYNEWLSGQGRSIDDFWNMSRVAKKAPFQYIVEVPKSISLANSKYLPSNYRTADLFADAFVAKTHLNSEYRTECGEDPLSGDFILSSVRKYTGITSCGDMVALYFDEAEPVSFVQTEEPFDENNAAQYEARSEKEAEENPGVPELNFKRICAVGAINRFDEAARHKSNLFSVIIRGTNFDRGTARDDEKARQAVESAKSAISNAVRQICEEYAPANGQLFKVYFE